MSTLQSYNYEDVHPVIEKKNTPESHLLIVHIPDGNLFGLTLLFYFFKTRYPIQRPTNSRGPIPPSPCGGPFKYGLAHRNLH